jgi:hypothetical protein
MNFFGSLDVPVWNMFPKSMEIIEAETVSETHEITSVLTQLNN